MTSLMDVSLTRRQDRNSVDKCFHLASCQRNVLSVKRLVSETSSCHITDMMTYIHDVLVGLQGVELGGQVIKRIIVDLVADFPRMNQFASLSPVPGFRDWLLDEIGTYVRLRGEFSVMFLPCLVPGIGSKMSKYINIYVSNFL